MRPLLLSNRAAQQRRVHGGCRHSKPFAATALSAASAIPTLGAASAALTISTVAYTLILVFVYGLLSESDNSARERVRLVVHSFVTARSIASFLVSTLSKKLLTAVAGVDLMVGHIARQRVRETTIELAILAIVVSPSNSRS